MQIPEVRQLLAELGKRLRSARLARDDTMAVFAQRLGVSERTVRAMESGSPAVRIETWLIALWLLDQLHLMQPILQPHEGVLDLIDAQHKPEKKRASKRRKRR